MKVVRKVNHEKGVEVIETSIPTPKNDEVLIKIEAVSICGSDVHMYEGEKGYEWIQLPLVLGHEFSGVVEKVGSTQSEDLVGKRVVVNPYVHCTKCDACLRGETNLCDYQTSSMDKVPAKSLRYGFRENGGMAEYAVVKEKNVLILPDDCPVEISGMLEAIGIGVRALERSSIQVGDSAVVIGPGPIGLAVLSVLSNLGLQSLIMVGLKKDKIRMELAKELGATHVIYADEENDVDAIKRITGGKGVDSAFEASGFHESLQKSVKMVRKGGEILLIGISGRESNVVTNEIVRGEINVKGVYGVTQQTMERTIHMASSGQYPFEKLVSHVLPLEEVIKGFELAVNKESIKIILKP